MGTNYYWRPEEGGELHIGKSSFGWCFSLHMLDSDYPHLNTWIDRFNEEGSHIYDEYGAKISTEKMIEIITDRKGDGFVRLPVEIKFGEGIETIDWDTFLSRNQAEFGPYGLLRHRVHCANCCDSRRTYPGVGDQTWDYLYYEFS